MDYQKWMDKIKEINDQINKNWEDILETCKKIEKIVMETYGLTIINIKIDDTYELQFSSASTKLIFHVNQYELPISDDLSLLDELEDSNLFYQFVFQWHKNKLLYEEKLEEFLTEWFKNETMDDDLSWL